MLKRCLRYAAAALVGFVLLGVTAFYVGVPDTVARLIVRSRFQAFPDGKPFSELPAAPDSVHSPQTLLKPADLLVTTAVWPVHLHFTREQWMAMAPIKIAPLTETHNPDGSRRLRNPDAERPGMLGVFGLHLPWSSSKAVEIAGNTFEQVAARYKGNGTFIDAMRDYKRSFKLDFNDVLGEQKIAGLTKLNLNNLAQDVSFIHEALAAEYYREVGVLASRTAFADVALTIDSEASRRRVGLYLIVENPDATWLKERLGKGAGALWKPVTTSLFVDRGTNWADYDGDYQPKTKLEQSDKQRILALAALVSHGSEEEFSSRLSEFLDLEAFARFLAAEVLTSNYDSFIGLGQNYLVYLDRATGRFAFAPWDLDHSWGEFFLVGSRTDKEQADIWRPWVGNNLFLERVLSVPAFRDRYWRELERQLDSLFKPERLFERIDQLANIVRPYLDAEPERRRQQFEQAVGSMINGKSYSLKHFVEARERSVRDQLAGRAKGRTVKTLGFF